MENINSEAQDNNWNGEGLPSVGQMVLIRNDGEKPVEVVVISGYQLCTRTNSGFLQMHNKNDMLPIPTPEQKAKQEEIEDMSMIACHVKTWVTINGI
jgi:hypothetical protein